MPFNLQFLPPDLGHGFIPQRKFGRKGYFRHGGIQGILRPVTHSEYLLAGDRVCILVWKFIFFPEFLHEICENDYHETQGNGQSCELDCRVSLVPLQKPEIRFHSISSRPRLKITVRYAGCPTDCALKPCRSATSRLPRQSAARQSSDISHAAHRAL